MWNTLFFRLSNMKWVYKERSLLETRGPGNVGHKQFSASVSSRSLKSGLGGFSLASNARN